MLIWDPRDGAHFALKWTICVGICVVQDTCEATSRGETGHEPAVGLLLSVQRVQLPPVESSLQLPWDVIFQLLQITRPLLHDAPSVTAERGFHRSVTSRQVAIEVGVSQKTNSISAPGAL